MATNENLLATVDALRHVNPRFWEPAPYQNRKGVWGMRFHFRQAYQYHFISVHNCAQCLQPSRLADVISGIEIIDESLWGLYANAKDVPGFYATARSTRTFDKSFDHWFMIGRSPESHFSSLLRGKARLSEEEIDLLRYLEERDEISVAPKVSPSPHRSYLALSPLPLPEIRF